MQIQTHGSNGPNTIIATAARTRRHKLHLPLALEARTAGIAPAQSAMASLSGHELRQIVAGMLG